MLIFEKGIDRIYKEDYDNQKMYIETVVRHIRHIPETMHEKYVEYLMKLKCFYVPHEDYMAMFFGSDIRTPNYGVYSFSEYCLYNQRLIIPIRGLDNSIKALCAYDNGDGAEEAELLKYIYSPKSVWDKSKYLFISRDEFSKSVKDGYVLVVDGIFDKITLSVLGYNASSMMGTTLSKTNKKVLSFVDKKIVIPDNDLPGLKLVRLFKRAYKNETSVIKQGKEWDIDDYLKKEGNVGKFDEMLKSILKYGYYLDEGRCEV